MLWAAGLLLLSTRTPGALAAAPLQDLVVRAVGADQAVHVQTHDGTVLAALNEDRLIHPASVSKIAATLALLASLGPDYRFATRVGVSGEAAGDALRGDLLVESSGDPFFIYESAFLVLAGLRRAGVRVVGRPQARVRTIGVLPGTRPIQDTVALLPRVDAIIAGEIREWESSEYVRDVVNAGIGKGLILVGRSMSEDAGMKVCADWLRPLVPEAPVRWLPAGDPYWRPTA